MTQAKLKEAKRQAEMTASSHKSVPGVKAKHAIITPACRNNRGDIEAFEEAVRRLRVEYESCAAYDSNARADFHLILSVARP